MVELFFFFFNGRIQFHSHVMTELYREKREERLGKLSQGSFDNDKENEEKDLSCILVK